MQRTFNFTDRKNLNKQDIDIKITSTGFNFTIDRLDEFKQNAKLHFIARDSLCFEHINAGYIKDLIDEDHTGYGTCVIKDISILNAHNLTIDVHIVDDSNKNICSRTDNIYKGADITELGKNSMFGFMNTYDGNKLYEIETTADKVIINFSKKIDNIKNIFKNPNSYETALLLPNIMKDAYIYVLTESGNYEHTELWRKQVNDMSDADEKIGAETETADILKYINTYIDTVSKEINVIKKVQKNYTGR